MIFNLFYVKNLINYKKDKIQFNSLFLTNIFILKK